MKKYKITSALFLLCILFSCNKYDLVRTNPHDPKSKNYIPYLPELTTSSPSTITDNSAITGGNITTDGGGTIITRGVCWATTINPTINGDKTKDGTGTGSFISNLTGLTSNKTYFIRSYATNSTGTAYGNQISFNTKIADFEGNTYNTVKIGTQVWMADNLKTTKFNDGTNILLVTNNSEWNNLIIPGYCWYNNDEATYRNIYGAMYNWYAVNTKKLCPIGWHVPNNTDWETLLSLLGGETVAGLKLKETGTNHWLSPNPDVTNESGFTGLPGGDRSPSGIFNDIGKNGIWWSSIPYYNDGWAYVWGLYYMNSVCDKEVRNNNEGFSIRCILGEAPILPVLTTTTITNVTQTTATSGGYITIDGGAIFSRGVCWATTINPTISDPKTIDGTGTGSFISNLTELLGNTTYYVRAYATNSSGTAYGNQQSFTTLGLGSNYQGGIVFYINGTGQHGLIAAPSDQSTGAPWGCNTTDIPGTLVGIGTGQANTTLILNSCNTAGIAALICNNLVLNGYDDWFLPSKDELTSMFQLKTLIGGFVNNGFYWSSSQTIIYGEAWEIYFSNGGWETPNKSETYRVRAVRSF
jgi:uncharacterized protein (TIGR02145 family)